jgi:long-subunit acyl-CoA synthetase (AMP-forming)
MERTEFDRLAATVETDQVHQLHRQMMLQDTANIIYTSGATAHPKGCMLPHEALTPGPSERARLRFFRACSGLAELV